MKGAFPTTHKKYWIICLLLGIMVFAAQCYILLSESEVGKVEICSSNSFLSLWNIYDIFFKCSLAFLAGGIISDFKFIKIGHI
jgi:hypothetical protein